MPRDTAQKNATIRKIESNTPDELAKELIVKDSVAEEIYEAAVGNPEEPPRDATTQDDVTTDGADDHDLRDASQGDVVAGGADLKGVGRKTGWEDVTARTPLRRTQRFR